MSVDENRRIWVEMNSDNQILTRECPASSEPVGQWPISQGSQEYKRVSREGATPYLVEGFERYSSVSKAKEGSDHKHGDPRPCMGQFGRYARIVLVNRYPDHEQHYNIVNGTSDSSLFVSSSYMWNTVIMGGLATAGQNMKARKTKGKTSTNALLVALLEWKFVRKRSR
ncbi:hypothetical protein P175DRAFT_0556232 [Aspergillus ochraceoroseus IBT 24754]|uniref:Uncharacterized protein n=1 Tax=Aspergillus ochraceoroseus IBT 24754 TaxID=1392256 RepID=A0A2T5M4X3_9EURO|nr:uncharacterized protein P175DRAFT_0556232 [Aspergillus ochraceoroseus IBT 24754]PTU23591.1 hypothetical protein P175DRAFT_0556232 [Aspergillus ochraceoroseus IBT 24754]